MRWVMEGGRGGQWGGTGDEMAVGSWEGRGAASGGGVTIAGLLRLSDVSSS